MRTNGSPKQGATRARDVVVKPLGEVVVKPLAEGVDRLRDATAIEPPGELREKVLTALGDAMRREFNVRLGDRSPASSWFVGVIAKVVIAVGIGAVIITRADVDALVPRIAILVGIYGLLELLTVPERPIGIYAYVAAWSGGGGFEATYDGLEAVAVSHVVPLAAGFVLYRCVAEPGQLHKRVGRTLWSAIGGLSLAVPVTMLLLFALLLGAEVWEVAYQEKTGKLIGLAAVAVVPQLLVLGFRLSRSIPENFKSAASDLDGHGEGGDAHARVLTRRTVARLMKINGHRRTSFIGTEALALLHDGFHDVSFAAVRGRVADRVVWRMRARIVTRLLLTVLGVGVLVFAYVYLIIVLLVSEEAAKRWAHTTRGWDDWVFGLPGGPYLSVAILVAVVAGALFLAHVANEEDLVRKLGRDYLLEPATTALLMMTAHDRLSDRYPDRRSDPAPEGQRPASPPPVAAPG